MSEPFQHPGYGFANHIDHHQAGEQTGEQRDDQDRFQRFEALRQSRITIDRLGGITGDETGNDPADEARAKSARQHTADHPRREARAVGDRVGDVTRQQRHHQFECGIATDLHQRGSQGALLFERGDAEHKRQSDHQAACHHHRQHERHAGQQVLIDARLLLLGGALGSTRCSFLRALGQRFVEGGLGLLEGDTRAATVDFFPGKTLGRHFDVTGQQHHIGLGNGLGTQRIARADRPLGFDLQVVAQSLGRLLQGFGGHERMGDTGRAGGNRHQSRRGLAGGQCLGNGFGGHVNLRLIGALAQHRLHVLQGLGRSALEHALADESRHVHRRTGHQQYPLGRLQRGGRQLPLRVRRIGDFDAGAPALALRCSIQQTGAQHTGDHAVRAGRNNG